MATKITADQMMQQAQAQMRAAFGFDQDTGSIELDQLVESIVGAAVLTAVELLNQTIREIKDGHRTGLEEGAKQGS
jgi:hypothetical protein